MCTNTGTRFVTECGEMLGVKVDPWLDDELMANIVSFSKLKEQHRITHDSDHTDSFFCHTGAGIIEFNRTEEGLCTVTPSEEHEDAVAEKNTDQEKKSLISTVGENMSHHLAADTARAKAARKLHHSTGGPTNHDFKVTLRSDQIENCPVVEKDADLVQDTFELDVPNLKSRGV